jgi:hypothetical protein
MAKRQDSRFIAGPQKAPKLKGNFKEGGCSNQSTIARRGECRRVAVGGRPPLLVYFKSSLDGTEANRIELVDLCCITLKRNDSLIEKPIQEDRYARDFGIGREVDDLSGRLSTCPRCVGFCGVFAELSSTRSPSCVSRLTFVQP